jgi:hypothetical protein
MHRDPIVEEVRRHREARAAKFGYDVRAMLEDARKRQATSGHRVVNLEGGARPCTLAGSRRIASRKRAYRRDTLRNSAAKA